MSVYDERDKWSALRRTVSIVAEDRLAEVEETERAIALKVLGIISERQGRYAQYEAEKARAGGNA